MKPIELLTESYLFENPEGEFRATPFYELSIEERIIYQNGKPKYYLDFNKKTAPFVIELKQQMESWDDLEIILPIIGTYLGLNWTTKHNIKGHKIENSQQTEKISLSFLDDLKELALELIFIATDKIENDILLDEKKLYSKFLNEDKDGNLRIEIGFIDGKENLIKLINFLFQESGALDMIQTIENKELIDLSRIKNKCISLDELESQYKKWIEISERENSMDEYGMLLGIITYIKRNSDKQNLILRTEKKSMVEIINHFDN